MNAKKWTIERGRPNSRGAAPVALYQLPDRTAKLLYADGTFVRFQCLACATRNEHLVAGDGPMLVQIDG